MPPAGRDGRREAERVDRVPDEHDRRRASLDQRLDGSLPDVSLEAIIGRRQDDHLGDAVERHRVDRPVGRGPDQREGKRAGALPGELASGGDQFIRAGPQRELFVLTAAKLGDREHAAHARTAARTISAICAAIRSGAP